jgi:cold shock CspA family protein
MARMKIDFYSVSGGYGFCEDGETRVFFNSLAFKGMGQDDPLPITGEEVEVTDMKEVQGKSQKSNSVVRLKKPGTGTGEVVSFNSKAGWGFIISDQREMVFLHKSDLFGEWVPVIGTRLSFFKGEKKGRIRACYVTKA